MGVHSQEQMTEFMRHHMTEDLGWVHRLRVRQLLNARVEDIRLDSPPIASNESNPETLSGQIERAMHDSYKQFSRRCQRVAVVSPYDRDSNIAVDHLRGPFCRFDDSGRHSRVVIHNNHQLWTFLRRTLDPST